MVKIYKQPFAHEGDAIVIPDTSQPDGKMSSADGWTPDYQLPKTDPNYRPVGRQEMNGVFKEVTEALGQVQVQGSATWSADGAPYPINAQVYHNGKQWISLRANSVEPTEGADWADPFSGYYGSVQVVDSIADLLALTEGQRKEGLRYLVKGYYAGSDLGGGPFQWVADSTAVADGGSVISVPGVSTGRWVRVDMGGIYDVTSFGAHGDGVTDDVDPIRRAISAIPDGGGVLYFPRPTAYYSVTQADITQSWSRLFKLRSDTTVRFAEGSRLKVDGAIAPDHCCVFGVDPTALPIKNLMFEQVCIEGRGLLPINNNPLAIGLFVEDGDPVGSIVGVEVIGGTFRNVDSSVYAVHRASSALGLGGISRRQVENVRVVGVNAYGSTGSFTTMDVKDGWVEGCLADGVDPALAYDAVSIHCGLNIHVTNNTFRRYGMGQVLNVRNSPENGTGSRDVTATGNMFEDCPTVATQVSLSGTTENVYGVSGVRMTGNTFTNVKIVCNINPGAATAGTPFNKVTFSDNTFEGVSDFALRVVATTTVFLEDSQLCYNEGAMVGSASGRGITITAARRCKISGNKIRATSNVEGYKLAELNTLHYCDFSGNDLWGDDALPVTFTSSGFLEGTFSDNSVRGLWTITTMTNSIAQGNFFRSAGGTHNGRSAGTDWVQVRNNIEFTAGALPSAGTWVVGDRIKNNAPSPGGVSGWVCTQSGTTGTWRGYGAIQA